MPQMALTGGAPAPITADFPFQSYFDSTLLQDALLVQTSGIINKIGSATGAGTQLIAGAGPVQIGGVAVQLHPSSQTPVAIDFTISGGPPSGPIFVKPGQIIRPGRFSSFNWGLPFGWLGGGVATLLVAQNEQSDFAAPANSEVIFHRTRLKVLPRAQAGVSVAAAAANWPIRFPWPNASQGASAQSQAQLPTMGVVNPTRIMARLNVATLAAGGAVTRFMFFNTDDFDRSSAYVVPTTNFTLAACVDVSWQAWAQSGITVTNSAAPVEVQVQELDVPTPIVRLGGDACVCVVADVTPGGDVVANQFIDVVRYGVL